MWENLGNKVWNEIILFPSGQSMKNINMVKEKKFEIPLLKCWKLQISIVSSVILSSFKYMY